MAYQLIEGLCLQFNTAKNAATNWLEVSYARQESFHFKTTNLLMPFSPVWLSNRLAMRRCSVRLCARSVRLCWAIPLIRCTVYESFACHNL